MQTALQRQVRQWNESCPPGTAVYCEVDPDRVHRTCSPATVLFGRRAVVHLEGFGGYFELSQVRPAQPAAAPAGKIAVLFPGQGAQSKGMGRDLFAAFPQQTRSASQILGYSIEKLCLDDPDGMLDRTQYTQAALYVVNALAYWRCERAQGAMFRPDFLLGHSLGEYNALLAAGAFDFETGLRLVMKRAELTGGVSGGAMAAVLGAGAERIEEILRDADETAVDLAGYNTPTQTVISGPAEAIERLVGLLAAQNIAAVRLRVSGAFHSRYMRAAQRAFAEFAAGLELKPPRLTVIANATGRPYEADAVLRTLCEQITSPVQWIESIRHVLRHGETQFVELGSSFLSGMVGEISAGAAS